MRNIVYKRNNKLKAIENITNYVDMINNYET